MKPSTANTETSATALAAPDAGQFADALRAAATIRLSLMEAVAEASDQLLAMEPCMVRLLDVASQPQFAKLFEIRESSDVDHGPHTDLETESVVIDQSEEEIDVTVGFSLASCPCCQSADVEYAPQPDGWICRGCSSFITQEGVDALASIEHTDDDGPAQPWDLP